MSLKMDVILLKCVWVYSLYLKRHDGYAGA